MTEGIEKFVADNKAMLDMISNGKFETEFQVMGNKVKIRVLDFGEMADAVLTCNGYDLAVKSFILQKEIVRRALISVNDIQMPDEKVAGNFLDRLAQVTVEYMYQKYSEARSLRDLKISTLMETLKNGSRSQTPEGTGVTANSSSQTGSKTSVL